jgi:XTP/dITP diphosphohydrolase
MDIASFLRDYPSKGEREGGRALTLHSQPEALQIGAMDIYLATGNAHKAEEFGRLFAQAGLKVKVRSARELGGMPYVEEITGTFHGNCRLKANALREIAPRKAWVLADDSGLCCDALQGGPGVDSAVYAGQGATDAQNRAKLLKALEKAPPHKRGARFECHLILLGPNYEVEKFIGQCWGKILEQEVGTGGFGYDSLFVPAGETKTFGELSPATKDQISHRAVAFQQLVAWMRSNDLGR